MINKGKLYLVATPIGNLEDITFRAIKTLEEVDFIAAEDTRQTLKLLNHYQITKKLCSYHRHTEETKTDFLIEKLNEGKSIALVSDAGTPAISDPRRRNCKKSNRRMYRNYTDSRGMCINKCTNSIRTKYKRIFILWIFTFK